MDCCFVGFVLDQLDRFDGLGCRAMFGGHGLFRGRTFFGIVSGDRLYLKTDGETVRDYVDRGMNPFRPGGGDALGTYYEVPADVLRDRGLLAAWARAADRAAEGAAGSRYSAAAAGGAGGTESLSTLRGRRPARPRRRASGGTGPDAVASPRR